MMLRAVVRDTLVVPRAVSIRVVCRHGEHSEPCFECAAERQRRHAHMVRASGEPARRAAQKLISGGR